MPLLSAIIGVVFHVVGWALVALLLGVLSVVVIGILVEGQLDDEIYASWPTKEDMP